MQLEQSLDMTFVTQTTYKTLGWPLKNNNNTQPAQPWCPCTPALPCIASAPLLPYFKDIANANLLVAVLKGQFHGLAERSDSEKRIKAGTIDECKEFKILEPTAETQDDSVEQTTIEVQGTGIGCHCQSSILAGSSDENQIPKIESIAHCNTATGA